MNIVSLWHSEAIHSPTGLLYDELVSSVLTDGLSEGCTYHVDRDYVIGADGPVSAVFES